MDIQIHFFDQRNGQRKEVTVPWSNWNGPFFWAEHSGSDDGNRSRYMYGHRQLSYSTYVNLIQIEKIVSEGQIVYQENISPLPPRLVAILVARNKFSDLVGMSLMTRTREELSAAIEQLKEVRQTLAACQDTTEMVTLVDSGIERAVKIHTYESDETVELDVNAEWDELKDCFDDFADLAEEASEPFAVGKPQ
jgi:hypothetical protein